jgi:iron complex outermembrane receptor protein
VAVHQTSIFCSAALAATSCIGGVRTFRDGAIIAVVMIVLSRAIVSISCATAADSDIDGLQEIIVTANKQLEPLQKAPEAITVLTGQSLIFAGVSDIRGAEDFVPSARFQQENAATEIYIRGVGSTLDFPQVTSPNVFNLNGISVPREATGAPLFDIDQIEVLPGPQGTLYGSSAMGGAINANLHRPTFDWESRALMEFGDFSLYHVSASQNLPLSETLAIRVAVDYLSHAGYQTSGADSQKDLAGRLSLLYRPTDDFVAYFWGSSVSKDGHPPNLVPKGINPLTGTLDPNRYLTSNPWNDQFPAPYALLLPYGQPQAEPQEYSNKMLGGQFDLKFAGDMLLTWIPSYLELKTSPDYWLGAFPGNESDNYRQITNELRISSAQAWGNWIAGLYAYDLDSNGIFTFGSFTPGAGVLVSDVNLNRIAGEAIFGQMTLNLMQGVRVTLGGRYSLDDRVGRGEYLDGTALAPFTYGRNFGHADYKVGIEYDIASPIMLYASTQTAYQPGTFNAFASTPSLSNAVNQANLTAYTAGIKNRLIGDRVQINAETFYYDYRGLFASAYNTTLNSNQTFNAQKTEIYGDQLDVIAKLSESDQVQVSVGYLHARNIRFTLPGGNIDYDGYQLQYAPDWTVSAGYFHDFSLPRGYIRARESSRFEDSFYADFAHTPGGRQQPYIKSDASLTYFSSKGEWSVGGWVKNIQNVAVIAATAGGSNLPALTTGATAFIEPPRTYGMRITYGF